MFAKQKAATEHRRTVGSHDTTTSYKAIMEAAADRYVIERIKPISAKRLQCIKEDDDDGFLDLSYELRLWARLYSKDLMDEVMQLEHVFHHNVVAMHALPAPATNEEAPLKRHAR